MYRWHCLLLHPHKLVHLPLMLCVDFLSRHVRSQGLACELFFHFSTMGLGVSDGADGVGPGGQSVALLISSFWAALMALGIVALHLFLLALSLLRH
ncbi:uncharacterized protein BJX67DRAFT_357340 [Aspergillus lucknowensis]|uniref:Uncharacterized protein n=1 Tax=Aspergillus lucknowensis TaxID=176173 RepID=A0ABR4LNV9_9EURO